MNRREFLHRGGPLAGLAALAGCLGSATPDAGDGTTTRRTTRSEVRTTTASSAAGTCGESGTTGDEAKSTKDGPKTTGDESGTTGGAGDDDPGDFSGIDPDAEGPFQTLSVGSRADVAFPDNNRPHAVRVWNDADETRELTVRVCRDARELLDRTVAFDPDAFLTVELNEPGEYQVSAGLADEQPTTFRVRRALFDCNASATDARVAPEGRVETVTGSTMMGCPGPEVADTSLSVEEGECGTRHRASVAYDGEQIRVEGSVRTPEPGYDLELADASYDGESGELEVRVQASEGDLWGVQCVGEVPYEATVDFERDLPEEVVVVHEVGDGGEEVTRKSR